MPSYGAKSNEKRADSRQLIAGSQIYVDMVKYGITLMKGGIANG
jgi:hypothetical protein